VGVEGRGGYFDEFGIIRDVMQNHLVQILCLLTMEAPASRDAEDVRNEKVKLLKAIAPITMDRIMIGQYGTNESGVLPYNQDPSVPKGSLSPTFAIAAVNIKNPRWDGVPFIMKCGKGLNERKVEIRVQFKEVPGLLYSTKGDFNELIFRIQPNEAIYWRINNKFPGLSEESEPTELELYYKTKYKMGALPDAYERLLLDVLVGNHNRFVRTDELEEAWRIFTPALHHFERHRTQPEIYTFGSRGPASADKFIENLGIQIYRKHKQKDARL